jgi:hypothetical protein
VVQQWADQAGFRWGMPATVNRRAFLGSGDAKEVAAGELGLFQAWRKSEIARSGRK